MIKPTPVVFLEKLGIFLKLEEKNPTGSVKDRPVFFMVRRALLRGDISEGSTLVEPTSGNTGIAMAMMGAVYNLKVILVVPESISDRKKRLLKSFGAELVETPAELGMKGAVEKAKEIASETKGIMLDQFNNPDNPLAHELTTGPEILQQMDYSIDAFVCGVGTGGTISGVSKVLKKFFGEGVKVFAVEPEESPVLSGGSPGKHGIEGIGAGFVPGNFNSELVDEIVLVPSDAAIDMARFMAKRVGISVGPSTGANVYATLKVKEKYKFSRIITVEMDGGIRYV